MADYRKFEKGRDQGDFSLLPELHASLSCLKVHIHSSHTGSSPHLNAFLLLAISRRLLAAAGAACHALVPRGAHQHFASVFFRNKNYDGKVAHAIGHKLHSGSSHIMADNLLRVHLAT